MASTELRRHGVQFVKFLFVGFLNTVFGYTVFAVSIFAGAGATLALILTYVIGVPFNFFTTRILVFKHPGGWMAFARFVGAYVIIYFVNHGLLALTEHFGAPPLLGQLLCIPPVAVFSFLLFKYVFKDRA